MDRYFITIENLSDEVEIHKMTDKEIQDGMREEEYDENDETDYLDSWFSTNTNTWHEIVINEKNVTNLKKGFEQIEASFKELNKNGKTKKN